MKIFISYSRNDKAFVESLHSDLSQLGHDVWMDQRLVGGQDWWDEILRNIRQCDLFVLALSPKSIESEACLLELKYASTVLRPFLPAMVLPTDPNFLPPEIAHAQYVDYTRSDREALLHLVAAITQLPPTPPLPDPLPEPPAMPQGPLYEVRRLIALATELDRKHQLWLVDMLQQNSTNPQLKPDVTELLAEFRKRNDLMADVLSKVDELLTSLQGDRQPARRPANHNAWLPVLIVGILVSVVAAMEFPSTFKGISYFEAVMDLAAIAVIYVFALRRKPRFLGWWLIFSAFALDCVWSLFAPFLVHRQGTLNEWIGQVGPETLLAVGLLVFRPPWQAGRRSVWHAAVAIGAAALAAIVAAKSMPSGYTLTVFGWGVTLGSALLIGASTWVALERCTPALIRAGLVLAALLTYVNEFYVTHVTGTFSIWMEWPWQVAGFILAAMAAYAAARWPAGCWPPPPAQPKDERPAGVRPKAAPVP